MVPHGLNCKGLQFGSRRSRYGQSPKIESLGIIGTSGPERNPKSPYFPGVVEAGAVVLAWCSVVVVCFFFFLLDFFLSDVDFPASADFVASGAFAGVAASGAAAAAGAAGAEAGAVVCAAADRAKALAIKAVRSLLMICAFFRG